MITKTTTESHQEFEQDGDDETKDVAVFWAPSSDGQRMTYEISVEGEDVSSGHTYSLLFRGDAQRVSGAVSLANAEENNHVNETSSSSVTFENHSGALKLRCYYSSPGPQTFAWKISAKIVEVAST